jgi:hypothetical protein
VDELPLRCKSQVDVGVAAASIYSTTDDHEAAVLVAFVDQVMAVGAALLPGAAVAGAEDSPAVILDEHGFA